MRRCAHGAVLDQNGVTRSPAPGDHLGGGTGRLARSFEVWTTAERLRARIESRSAPVLTGTTALAWAAVTLAAASIPSP